MECSGSVLPSAGQFLPAEFRHFWPFRQFSLIITRTSECQALPGVFLKSCTSVVQLSAPRQRCNVLSWCTGQKDHNSMGHCDITSGPSCSLLQLLTPDSFSCRGWERPQNREHKDSNALPSRENREVSGRSLGAVMHPPGMEPGAQDSQTPPKLCLCIRACISSGLFFHVLSCTETPVNLG